MRRSTCGAPRQTSPTGARALSRRKASPRDDMSTGRPADGEAAWWPLLDIVLRRHKGGRVMAETSKAERTATKTLTRLNQEYVDAFMKADVEWYRVNLAHDFLCTEPDGSVLTRD